MRAAAERAEEEFGGDDGATGRLGGSTGDSDRAAGEPGGIGYR
jgi:hypothetical protein